MNIPNLMRIKVCNYYFVFVTEIILFFTTVKRSFDNSQEINAVKYVFPSKVVKVKQKVRNRSLLAKERLCVEKHGQIYVIFHSFICLNHRH